MEASIFWMLGAIAIAGAIGGAVNAFISDNGFMFPQLAKTSDGTEILRPGFVGNILIGSIASCISWGLYGPLTAYAIMGTSEALKANASPEKLGLSLASLASAVLLGIGGARWLSDQVDKNLLRATAADAANKPGSPDKAKQIMAATPAKALQIAKEM